MKKLFLLLTISTFIFCGCSDDDKDNGPKTYVLNLPSYETHTLDLGDVENPVDTWSSSYEDQGTTYTTNYFQTLSNLIVFRLTLMDLVPMDLHSPTVQ